MVRVTQVGLQPGRRRGPAPVGIPVQAKHEEQDVDGVMRASCSKCQITYYGELGSKPRCPLCDAERQIAELQAVIHMMRNEVEELHDNSNRMRANLDVITAIKQALDTIGPEDLAFLKSVLYRYREDHTAIALRATHGQADKGQKRPPPNGFIAVPKVGEPEAHYCRSIGGVAIAAYYEEVVRSAGPVNALTTLMQALGGALAPGGGGP